jgi:hypothetical protein
LAGGWFKINERFERLALDHDHTTGEFRGFLCQKCNQAIGLLNDSPELLRIAAEYIEVMGGDRQ